MSIKSGVLALDGNTNLGDRYGCYWGCLVAQMVKNLPAMRETCVLSLGCEDPLEEGMAIHSRILTWRIPMDRGVWRATGHGVAKSWTRLSNLAQHT